MRILVHDDDYAGATPRWRPQDAGSNWTPSARTPRPCGKHGRRHWLAGLQPCKPRRATMLRRPRGSPITASIIAGVCQRNEAIHPMADVAMSFRIEDIHGRGLLWLQATDGRDEFMVQIDPGAEEVYGVRRTGKEPQAGAASGDLPGSLARSDDRGLAFRPAVPLGDRRADLGNRRTSTPPDHRPLPTSRWRSALKDWGWSWIVCGFTGTYTILSRSSLGPAAGHPLAGGGVSSCVAGGGRILRPGR